MTPKEKAKELFDKMFYSKSEDGYHSVNSYRAKQCALIAVDEIMNVELIKHAAFEFYDVRNYWREVKQEIQAL
jgi:hypothetical protein